MENFGAAFDDDFFETNTKNTKKSSESFNTKLYDPLVKSRVLFRL